MFPLKKESMERDSRGQVTLEIRMQQLDSRRNAYERELP